MAKFKSLLLLIITFFGISYGIPNVLAVTKPSVDCGGGGGGANALPGCNADINWRVILSNVVPTVINFVIFAVAIISFAFLVKGGIEMITALGQEEKMKKAVQSMVTSIVGLVLALLSYAIVAAVVSLKIFG